MGTTSSTSSATFTGSSSYSADLQQVISRAVSFASLPMQQLQNTQTNLQSQQTALQSLSSQFQSLQTALDAVNQATGSGSYSANLDDSSIANVSIGSGASVGSFELTVDSLGSRTNTMSSTGLNTVSDPNTGNIDSSSSYTLTVDGNSYTIADTAGSLNGLAQAINSSGANVQATVVNVGNPTSPDYRLSVQGQNYAPTVIQLSDGTNSLLTTVSTGSYVTYQVNGQPATPINSTLRTVSLSPGVSVDLMKVGTANVDVTQNVSSLSTALTSFVSAYNSVVDELAKSRGQNGGALTGQSIIYSASSALHNLTGYTNLSGEVASMSDIGLTFDQNGHLSFDSSVLTQAASTSLTGVLNFFGSEDGGGFLQAANSALSSIDDSSTGLLTQVSGSLTDELSSVGDKIKADQDQINQLQTNLTAQISAADATIASLEQQVSYFTNLFSTMRANASQH